MKFKNIAISAICATLLLVTVNASEDKDSINRESSSHYQMKSINDLKGSTIETQISKVDYQVNVNLSDETPRLAVYSVNEIDKQDIINIREKMEKIFKFKPAKTVFNKSRSGLSSTMTIDDKGKSIEYFDSGAVFYSSKNLISKESPDILKLNGLDKKSAESFYKKRAIEFLKRNRLLKKGSRFKKISYATIQKLNKSDLLNLNGGKSIESSINKKIVGTAIHFNYNIGDIPTWGAGSETTIYFDQFGVSGYFDQIRTFSKAKRGESRFISSSEAVNRYMSHKRPKNLLRTPPIKVEKVDITDVKLVYHLDAVNKVQREIKPHYLISGTFKGEDFNGKMQETEFKWLEPAEG